MKKTSPFFQSKAMAIILLAFAFALIYNPFTKFPITFIAISCYILGVTFFIEGNLRSLQFKKIRPKDLVIILLLYAALEMFMDFAVQPAVSKLLNEPVDFSAFESIKGNFKKYLKYLIFMWISAAFGEELLFRAFAFAQLKKVLGSSKPILIFGSAVLFALPHLYQGTSGLIMTFLFGLAFAFIFAKFQNIWVNIIIHGLIDTVFLTLAYFGTLSFYA